MRNDLKIRTLVERFFDGETSLAEEQELYSLFREGNVPEDLLQYRELFAGFEDIRLPQQKPTRRKWGWIASIAASIVVLIAAGTILLTRTDRDECVAYIYGEKCTDEAVVMQQMEATLNDMGSIPTVDEQMRDFFSE